MTDTLASDLLTNSMLYFGGPAVVIAVMSAISAYNHWVSRKLLQSIYTEMKKNNSDKKEEQL
jgi:Na+/proline symporter